VNASKPDSAGLACTLPSPAPVGAGGVLGGIVRGTLNEEEEEDEVVMHSRCAEFDTDVWPTAWGMH
jgi:hypothetical protein